MTSFFEYRDQHVDVSNVRFNTLIAFAIEVAEATEKSEVEKNWIEKLKKLDDNGLVTYGLYVDAVFPTIQEQEFWAERFYEVAQAVFERRIGNQAISDWQASMIHNAYAIAMMLKKAADDIKANDKNKELIDVLLSDRKD